LCLSCTAKVLNLRLNIHKHWLYVNDFFRHLSTGCTTVERELWKNNI